MLTPFRAVLLRDLTSIRAELAAYPDDAAVWAARPGLPNSAGTLAIHVAGNLLHFVGAGLARTGYVRDRDAEFAERDLSRAEIDRRLAVAVRVVDQALAREPADDLATPFPLEIAGVRLTVGLALAHLCTHLAYHLGQIDYHRRVVTGQGEGIGAIAVGALRG